MALHIESLGQGFSDELCLFPFASLQRGSWFSIHLKTHDSHSQQSSKPHYLILFYGWVRTVSQLYLVQGKALGEEH